LIGIILGALSLGYYLGGRFSAHNPKFSFLATVLLLAGLNILLIAIIKDPVLSYSMKLGVKLGAIMSTLWLFTLPSILLGMISPYAIRLKIKDVADSGGVAGNLYALSTLGSIFGTFLAGFYLIPTCGSTQILFGLSSILILTALLGGKKILKLSLLALVIALWSINQLIPSPYIFEADSVYNHIRVLDGVEKITNKKVRSLYLATEPHSAIYRDSDELVFKYHQLYLVDNLFKPEIKTALTLSGGAYVSPIDFLKRYPESEMTVVEIDPQVTAVARKYFRLKDDPRLRIYHQDGRIFLNETRETFDVIYGDAFASYFSIPFQLTTKEAMEKIYQSLNPDGILILNLISSLEGPKSKFFQAEYKTIQEIFPQVYIFPTKFDNNTETKTDNPQNIILIASKNPSRLTKQNLQEKATAKQKELLDYLLEKKIDIDPKTKILTDNFAPVDYYISKLL